MYRVVRAPVCLAQGRTWERYWRKRLFVFFLSLQISDTVYGNENLWLVNTRPRPYKADGNRCVALHLTDSTFIHVCSTKRQCLKTLSPRVEIPNIYKNLYQIFITYFVFHLCFIRNFIQLQLASKNSVNTVIHNYLQS